MSEEERMYLDKSISLSERIYLDRSEDSDGSIDSNGSMDADGSMDVQGSIDADQSVDLNGSLYALQSMDTDGSVDINGSTDTDGSMFSEGIMYSDGITDSDENMDSNEDSELEDDSDSSRNILNWISAIQTYMKEPNVKCLNLSSPCMRIPFQAVESILQFLPDSGITELILDKITFPPEKINNLSELLKKSKVEKLSTKYCFSSCGELLDLAKVLNDTKITDWNATTHDTHQSDVKGRELVSCLLHSRLTKLTVNLASHVDTEGASSFIKGLPNTSLTCLQIVSSPFQLGLGNNVSVSLFSQLPLCQIKDLDLSYFRIGYDLIKELSRNLAASNIEKLNLECNDITDAGLDVLAQGLVNSNLSELNIRDNIIPGLNNFGHYLKHTKIKVLNLGSNRIIHNKMFAFPNFLKDSMVEELDISTNKLCDNYIAELIRSLKYSKVSRLNLSCNANLGIQSLIELAAVLKETSLEDVNLSSLYLPSETFDILNGCFKESKLKHIELVGSTESTAVSCLRLIEGARNSSVLSIDMQNSRFFASHAELFAGALMNSTFTHLNLSYCKLRDVFTDFALNLKYTSITHLNISYCGLEDENIQLLAEHLIETKIVDLNLSTNFISKEGVVALGCCPQTSVIHLWLDHCPIEHDGLETLAKNFTGSLITSVSVDENLGDKVFLIEKVLLENRARSLKLVAFFKLVFPENGNGNFCFHQCIHDKDVDDFLEECLQFHKIAVEQPAVVSVLLEEKSLSFSRMELVDLLLNKFPRQFVEFISDWVEGDISEHVQFLERAEELGLTKIVENLLLLRPLYTISEAEGILHPLVYTLLHKYKQPICNIEIDPSGISRITGYFKEHSDIEGAADVVNLLTATKKT